MSKLEESLTSGGNVLLVGGPGTGKTTLLRAEFARLVTGATKTSWSPVLALTPDRRRAEDFEAGLPARVLGGVRGKGGHRLVRAANSYAYLVISQWLVERVESKPRPHLTGGAEEDLWWEEWFRANSEQWAEVLPEESLSSEVLRMEARNILARLGQRGLGPADLRELSRRADVPEWDLLAEAYEAYAGAGEVGFSPETPHLDAARLQIVAARILKNWAKNAGPAGVLGAPPIPEWILVDDLQDYTPATVFLLEALVASGAKVLAATSPDTATAEFRGADPQLGESLASRIELGVVRLEGQRRMAPAVHTVVEGVRSWISPASAPPTEGHLELTAPVILAGTGRRGSWIAGQIRRNHYLHQIPWRSQAVIVRSAADIEPLRRQLSRADVPLAPGLRASTFTSIPVTAALLELLSPTLEEPEEQALFLLRSPLCNVDQLRLYRLLQESGVEARQTPATLIAWLEDPQTVPSQTADTELRESIRRASVIWQARETVRALPARQGLWELWDAAGIGPKWQREVVEGTAGAERADARLDAVMALFRRADLWEQQVLAAGGGEPVRADTFAAQMLAQTIESDSIAEAGLRRPGVEILTVTQAAGREWDAVFLVGLQDGAWPAPGASTGLLQLARLEQLLAAVPIGESVTAADQDALRADLDRRAAHFGRRKAEARLLASAASRAKDQLHIVSVENNEEAASPFLNYLVDRGALRAFRNEAGVAQHREVPPAFDLASLVGLLRYRTVDPQASEAARTEAAGLLALLAARGIAGADPSKWVGAGALTTEAPIREDKDLYLSPSALQRAEDCPLQWFLGAVHGNDAEGLFRPAPAGSAQIGTLIHEIAEQYPDGTAPELDAELLRRWPELGLDEDAWWVEREKEAARQMLRELASYFTQVPGEVETERRVALRLEESVISGRIDRIEHWGESGVRIVDIKTGRKVESANVVQTNLQLGAYQLALAEEYRIESACLLALRHLVYKTPVRRQEPLDEEGAENLKEQLDQISKTMRGPQYQAVDYNKCRHCPFRFVCPLQEQAVRNVT